MRQAIGGAWLLGIVLTFMMVLVAFISITINYSNAFQIKSKMINVIEEYEGLNVNSLRKIDELMSINGYTTTFNCEAKDGETVVGVTGSNFTKNPKTPQNYCVTREAFTGDDTRDKKYYYTVTVAFNFDLPILGNILKYKVKGDTKAIRNPIDIGTNLFGL